MKYGLCLEMALTDRPFEDRIRIAAGHGFKFGEMWFVDATYKGTPENLAKTAAACGLKLTNTVIAPPDASFGGGLVDPAKRDLWLERTRISLDFNQRAGIPMTVVCTGNVIPGRSHADMRSSVVEGLKRTVELAEQAGIMLLLEALNTRYDHAGYWLASSDLGAEVVREVGSERLRLLFDCYHMQIMEGDLINHIRRNLDVIGHFHSAGVPGRFELFKGEVDYRFVIGEIARMGYEGVFGLEYQPSMDGETSLRESLSYLADVKL